MVEIIMKNILYSSLISSGGIVLVIILRKPLFKEYPQSFKYYLWLAIIIKMLLPFKIPINIFQSVDVRLFNTLKHSSSFIEYNTEFDNSNIINSRINTVYSDFHHIDVFKILLCFWLIGVGIVMIYHIFTYLNFKNKIKHLTYDVYDKNIKAIYSTLLLEMNIKRTPSLKFSRGISTALGIGILKPAILLPNTTYNSEEIRWILKHELTHYKRHDLLYKVMVLITMSLHWFNPFVYIMWNFINSDCELSCDEAVLKHSNTEEVKGYALTLVDSLRLNKLESISSRISTGFNTNKNILKWRLENMFNIKKGKKGIIAGCFISLIVMASFVSVNTFVKAADNKVISSPVIGTRNINNNTISTPVVTSTFEPYRELVQNTDKKIVTKISHYNYKTASTDQKKKYEDFCKANNITPDPSQIIYVRLEK